MPPLLPRDLPFLCGVAPLQWSVESHLYETVPVPVNKVVKAQKERVSYQLVLHAQDTMVGAGMYAVVCE